MDNLEALRARRRATLSAYLEEAVRNGAKVEHEDEYSAVLAYRRFLRTRREMVSVDDDGKVTVTEL